MILSRATVWALLALMVQVGVAQADDWADDTGSRTNDPAYARSKAICRLVRSVRPPPADEVSPAEASPLRSCDTQTLYYGGKTAANYLMARRCAMAKTRNGRVNSDEVFGGFTILMQLYANGQGVPRNLDLAAHFACNLDGAPAEMQGRIDHLVRLKTQPESKTFDFCDDITSGLAEGYCSGRDAKKDDVRRQASLDSLQARVDEAARASFAALRKAAYDYANQHGMNEVDLTGSARDTFIDEAETAERNAFVTLAREVLTTSGPVATTAQVKAADVALNRNWQALKRRGPRVQPEGTVVFEDVLKAEQSWIRYRDAFVTFSHTQWRKRSTAGLVRRLTLQRANILADLAAD